MTRYQNATSTRRESRTQSGRFRGGLLSPVMATVLRESESCVQSQQITFELDPIMGRMLTPITAEMITVAVPVAAIDAIKNPETDTAGNTEILRSRLMSGVPLFDLEAESEISKRLGVVPRSIGGVLKVNEVARLAHNAAVNFLRQRKYVDSVQVLAENMDVTPALISQTVLDRMNGVLDPEDRVNGSVSLSFGSVKFPVEGIGKFNAQFTNPSQAVRETDKATSQNYAGAQKINGANVDGSFYVEEDANNPGFPAIYANTEGASAGSVSLTDFYNAELMDGLVRQMRQMIDANPEYGEEMIQRWAHGLSVDNGKVPYVVHQSQQLFGQSTQLATDTAGVTGDVMRSDNMASIRYTAPIGSSELGMVLITFASVKPDEAIASQPHPFLSDVWGATNYVADEMARDPVAVTMRELDAGIAAADEGTVAFYTGLNELKRAYINYGFTRNTDLTTVASKTAIWQLEVPMSVTPESVLYPEDLSHYPFADETAEVCTYTISSVQTVSTPIVFGPTPVEELAIVETADIFEDEA